MNTDPARSLLSGTFSRSDLLLVVFCLVDDWMKLRFGASNAPRTHRGPRSDEISDAEVLTLLLVAELCHCRRERAWLRQVRASYGSLFPSLPDDSRFSRRAERVAELLRSLRQAILYSADASVEPFRILDSFPMPLCACYRIRQSTLPISGATFGYNDSKRQYYHGLRPALLLTFSGFVEDIILAPGNCNDTPLLARYLDECIDEGRDLRGQVWVMDKGFRNKQLQRIAKDWLGLTLLPRQQEPRGALPSALQAMLDVVRKPIEGVIGVLTECMGIEHMLVKTDRGLYRRTQAKATACCLAAYFNRLLGLDQFSFARYAV